MLKICILLFLIPVIYVPLFAQYPTGFAEEVVYDEFTYPAGILFGSDSIAYVYELDGKVWAIENGEIHETPLIDITEEVGFWADHGLISAALDPDFQTNGYVYLLYNVDRHHLRFYGTDEYDPNESDDFKGGMGRLTRYTINTSNWTTIHPGSRHIVLGDTAGSGIPIASQGHGVGALLFGEDGSLLVSAGDANSHNCCYNGEGDPPGAGYDDISFSDGVLSEQELLGAFRAQFTGSLSGKILRIDPETGQGIPNNPFFVPGEPELPQSKIWALGFRNPYRMVIRPGTGWGPAETGYPGTLFLSDVGETKWEEINIIREGGGNYGWPIYEGHELHQLGYAGLITKNPLAPNPLFGGNNCQEDYFTFQDLLLQENQNHDYFFQNPCDPTSAIPLSIPKFAHERPALAYPNSWGGPPEALFPSFDENGIATTLPITTSSLPNSESFRGISGAGGVFLKGASIPEEYQNTYLLADFEGWLRAFHLNENNDITNIEHWSDSIGRPVNMIRNPHDDCVYITSLFPSFVKRICFGGNLRPVVSCNPDTIWGPSGSAFHFDASASYDPEGGSLDFTWDFGDGSMENGPVVSHTYHADKGGIETYIATVTVIDSAGAQNTASVLISLNNTPPEVEIISVDEGHLYSPFSPTVFDLIAKLTDREESEEELEVRWEFLLHHNHHFHLLDEYDFRNGSAVVYPTGCGEDDRYWYEFKVKTTDRGGLTSTDRKMIYPDCENKLSAAGTPEYTLYPNPVTNELTIQSSNILNDEITYNIYNSVGELIVEQNIPIYNDRFYFMVNTSFLKGGIYIIAFTNGGNQEYIRFVKH